YVVKRIKPECLTVTSFLMTRVHYSTEQDWTKLQRLLNYLSGTQEIPLTLEMDEGPIEIVANIDSSHASHGDYRGHTGIFITLGKGAIQAISTKQPINTKSSAESELVAASDGATPAINVLNIITCQGIQVKSLIIEQDNKSTLAMIALLQNNKPHLEIAYSTSGVYNTPRYILKILQHYLVEVLDTEAILSLMNKKKD
ncbi:MAG: Ty1/Copia family ribonuclease HI, partial [Chlamydiae bacterium]|nr:Ty1/Copia family ribonuclease HI [Chlamydiota bacterium]